MQLFYCNDIAEGLCTLDTEESRHAIRVMRMRAGTDIDITDGRGTLYHGRIVAPDERACVVDILSQATPPPLPPVPIHLAVAPTKNPSRMEWLIEKAVETGITAITLLQCDHSERSFLKTDRLEKLAISAMKQSLHLTLPTLHTAVPLRQWLADNPVAEGSQAFIAHCEAGMPRTSLLEALRPHRPTTILIGPEGDFSPDEISLSLAHGFQPVSLGNSRLRTETAALYAVVACNFVNAQ